jgi:hypothetical protein
MRIVHRTGSPDEFHGGRVARRMPRDPGGNPNGPPVRQAFRCRRRPASRRRVDAPPEVIRMLAVRSMALPYGPVPDVPPAVRHQPAWTNVESELPASRRGGPVSPHHPCDGVSPRGDRGEPGPSRRSTDARPGTGPARGCAPRCSAMRRAPAPRWTCGRRGGARSRRLRPLTGVRGAVRARTMCPPGSGRHAEAGFGLRGTRQPYPLLPGSCIPRKDYRSPARVVSRRRTTCTRPSARRRFPRGTLGA